METDPDPQRTDPKLRDTDPPAGTHAWIAKGINDLGDRLDRIEKRLLDKIDGLGDDLSEIENRLKSVEKKIWWTIGAAAGIGGLIVLLSQMLSFDFVIQIVPKPDEPSAG